MASEYPIRPISPGEYPAFAAVHSHAFNSAPHGQDRRERALALMEFERSLAAFDGTTLVGKAGAYSLRLCVPGAVTPVAGVTMVGVLPSHRRRGILSALMRRQLHDIHDRGEAVAVLWASEAGIYERYGYGPASWHAAFSVNRHEVRLRAHVPGDPGLRLRIAEPGASRDDLARVYDTVLDGQPGLFERDEAWWNRVLAERDPAPTSTPLRCVIAEDDDGPRGYALFTAQEAWDEDSFLPAAKMAVQEVMTADPSATAVIWRDLLSRDLIEQVRADLRPVDDPLIHLLADPRRLRARVSDGLWARVVDVGAAAGQRHYACPVEVVLDVVDDVCPWNSGRWRLAAGPDGSGRASAPGLAPPGGYRAVCERTTAPADLTLPAHALGAVYLGGTRLGPLRQAGIVIEHRPGAVAALSAAMAWDPAPWCPVIF